MSSSKIFLQTNAPEAGTVFFIRGTQDVVPSCSLMVFSLTFPLRLETLRQLHRMFGQVISFLDSSDESVKPVGLLGPGEVAERPTPTLAG